MGMTNGQFKSFIRLVIGYLQEIFELDEIPEGKSKEILHKIADILQQSLED